LLGARGLLGAWLLSNRLATLASGFGGGGGLGGGSGSRRRPGLLGGPLGLVLLEGGPPDALHLLHRALQHLPGLLGDGGRLVAQILEGVLDLGLADGIAHLADEPLSLGLDLLARALEVLARALDEVHELLLPLLGHSFRCLLWG